VIKYKNVDQHVKAARKLVALLKVEYRKSKDSSYRFMCRTYWEKIEENINDYVWLTYG
jgi:hypothetical protein